MSILIEGMEMPKDYEYVDVRIFRDGTATTASAEKPFYKKMDVVEVPAPHGDLIDRGKLREKEFIHDGDAYAVVMSRDIRNAATIIPAEIDDLK